jgi:hypothetical protein
MARSPALPWVLGALAVAAVVVSSSRSRASVKLPTVIPIGETTRERIVSLALGYLAEWKTLDEAQRAALIESFWLKSVGSIQGAEQGWPWSAAFIVAVVNEAQPGALPSTARHTDYARAALTGTGYAAEDARTFTDIRPGDLVLKPRPGGAQSFDDLANPAGFDAHADIVTAVSPSYVQTVGGNKIGGALAEERYGRNPDGSLTSPAIAVLRLKEQPA